METVVESVADHPSTDSCKLNEVSDKPSVVEDVCHKSNGVAESANVVPDSSEGDNAELDAGCTASTCVPDVSEEVAVVESTSNAETNSIENSNIAPEVTSAEAPENEVVIADLTENVESTAEIADTVNSETKDCLVNNVQMEEEIVESEIVEPTSDNVRFETEILVESNDNDVNEIEIQDAKTETESTNNILSELGQGIELSEALRSSDVTENIENNNCPIRQEVFNKEELLDILEGNDEQQPSNQVVDILNNANLLEVQLAMEQITRLKNNRKQRLDTPRKSNLVAQKPSSNKEESKKDDAKKGDGKKIDSKKVEGKKVDNKKVDSKKVVSNKEENIVNALVKDWDDDEPMEDQDPKTKESPSQPTDQDTENAAVKEESAVDSSTDDIQTPDLNKSTDDGHRQRRLGRVIKKKVIFDPDNPDTYTKSKTVKSKEPENDKDKDQHQPKKTKLDQASLRAKSKSPISKMQWKKPPPKNSKQNKRLTEVDKLLMDEGAVNMIYQLTPEAPKGKKNMKTKAEFIKKLQSSTPEGKEMKFRERKKESMKLEEGEARKILGGKQRSSLSSSIKSPSVSEDFETHSADDSIIYRRHSSSSYSSSCMSPRRLSDVETNLSAVNSAQVLKDQGEVMGENNEPVTDVLQPDSSVSNEIINKDDCLSLKKKLNSKLSLALNKRKRESGKTDKPIKKKVLKTEGVHEKGDVDNFKYLSLTFDHRVAEICIRKSGSKYDTEVLKEIEEALTYVDARKDISLTLLISECGALCSDLELSSLLDGDADKRITSAQEIAESVRSLLTVVSQHTKVLCSGVWAACAGVALALVALSDVALASERAAFALHAPPQPAAGLAALNRLPHSVVNDLVIFGRQISASEALQSGLVSRVLWPGGVGEQIQTIAKEIASQPPQALLLKKKLLTLSKTSESTFLSQLENESALMVEYWISDEGQEALRADMDGV